MSAVSDNELSVRDPRAAVAKVRHWYYSIEPRSLLRGLARRALTGNDGVPHHAVLARPV